MKKQTLIIALAVTALFATSASAGSYDSDLDADIINNQMVGQEPVGRWLTAEELAFDPILDADIYDEALAQGSSTSLPVVTVFDFDYSGENEPNCPASYAAAQRERDLASK